jgi:endonuclease-3 related protein
LREALLALDGVGPETADSILLYAFDRPAVVVDEYLRRLVRRLRAPSAGMADDDLRESIFAEIGDTARLNELHALIVEHGKRHCASRPRCAGCLLRQACGLARRVASP